MRLESEIKVNTAQSTFETATDELTIQLNKNAADIAKARTDLELADIDLEKWREGDRSQQLQEAKLAVQSARSRHGQAQKQYEVSLGMHKRHFVTTVELEEDKLRELEADFALRNAETSLEVLERYTFKKDRITFESAVRDATETLSRTEARSPR